MRRSEHLRIINELERKHRWEKEQLRSKHSQELDSLRHGLAYDAHYRFMESFHKHGIPELLAASEVLARNNRRGIKTQLGQVILFLWLAECYPEEDAIEGDWPLLEEVRDKASERLGDDYMDRIAALWAKR